MVPTVYRYFPDKYAVLHALGAVVMDKQNQVCQDWFNAYSTEGGGSTSGTEIAITRDSR
jgi:AcrR family transcriptional regulator